MAIRKKGRPITAGPSQCTGCLICQLRCSFRFERAFNPSRAHIKVLRLGSATKEYEVSFTEGCDNCGICARFCPYGALVQESKAKDS